LHFTWIAAALGFALEDTVFEIAPACNVYLNVHWNVPADFEVGVDGRHFRETVLFKWNGKHRLSMTLVGCAVLPAVQRKVGNFRGIHFVFVPECARRITAFIRFT
jgi:hypothetical protein